jgi:hypothetical protein
MKIQIRKETDGEGTFFFAWKEVDRGEWVRIYSSCTKAGQNDTEEMVVEECKRKATLAIAPPSISIVTEYDTEPAISPTEGM